MTLLIYLILIVLRNACRFTCKGSISFWETHAGLRVGAIDLYNCFPLHHSKVSTLSLLIRVSTSSIEGTSSHYEEPKHSRHIPRVNSCSPPEAPLKWQTWGTFGILATQVPWNPTLLILIVLRNACWFTCKRSIEYIVLRGACWFTCGCDRSLRLPIVIVRTSQKRPPLSLLIRVSTSSIEGTYPTLSLLIRVSPSSIEGTHQGAETYDR
jgi:hypothetical protein